MALAVQETTRKVDCESLARLAEEQGSLGSVEGGVAKRYDGLTVDLDHAADLGRTGMHPAQEASVEQCNDSGLFDRRGTDMGLHLQTNGRCRLGRRVSGNGRSLEPLLL